MIFEYTKNLIAELGYLYQIDRVQYDSDTEATGSLANEGDVNQVTLSQHHTALIFSYQF